MLELRGKGGSTTIHTSKPAESTKSDSGTPDKNKKNDSLQVRSQFKWLSLVSATAAWLF